MKRPTNQQFETACLWLEHNEGTDGEREACQAVADWIDSQTSKGLIKRVKALLKKGHTKEQILRMIEGES